MLSEQSIFDRCEKLIGPHQILEAAGLQNPRMAFMRSSLSVVRYIEVVPTEACPRLFCTTWMGTGR